jgi:hypothetical protein
MIKANGRSFNGCNNNGYNYSNNIAKFDSIEKKNDCNYTEGVRVSRANPYEVKGKKETHHSRVFFCI